MNTYFLTENLLNQYRHHLVQGEKATATIQKYIHDLTVLSRWTGTTALTKERLVTYKAELEQQYRPASVNAVISSLNGFFKWCGWHDLTLKAVKIQREVFRSSDRELTKEEYQRLLDAARTNHDVRLWLVIETICATGIRVSELQFITIQSARSGRAEIRCKGKNRIILLPKSLCRQLLRYASARQIKSGAIFVTRSGRLLDRSNIWKELRKLCKLANVKPSKVFPHNLRHLFALTFYQAVKDIAKLADILGHSSIQTTRIYITSSGYEHERIMERLGLIQKNAPIFSTT